MLKGINTSELLFFEYIKDRTSPRISGRIGSYLNRYMKYVIDAILHGYTIRYKRIIKFSLSKIPMSDSHRYPRNYLFKSKLTSDWLFFIDIECKLIERSLMKYIPTIRIKKQIRKFINSEKVYELIR